MSPSLSDKAIIAAAKKEPHLYEQIYRRYASKVFNYFWYRLGHDYELAEDLMQETFVRAFAYLPKWRQRGYSYLTYLLTIAHNLLVSYLRRKRTTISLEQLVDVPAEVTRGVEKKLAAEKLWRAVQELSPNERDALLLYYREGLPVKEIAVVMGKTPNAVKIYLTRARQKLKKHPHLRELLGCFTDHSKVYTAPVFLQKTE